MNTLRVQRNATQRKPLLCLSLSNSYIKIFEKASLLTNFFVSRFAFFVLQYTAIRRVVFI